MPTEQLKQPQIFLCHASEDKPEVLKIYERLKSEGFKPWLDEKDIGAGKEWRKEIPKAMKESDFVLIFFSKTSVRKRGYVQKEFKLALKTLEEIPEDQIYIIPARLDDCIIPESFTHLQRVDIFVRGGFAKVIGALRLESETAKMNLAEVKSPISSYNFRCVPRILSESDVKLMLEKYDFYCAGISPLNEKRNNPDGKGIAHDFISHGETILDKTTSLLWQRAISRRMDFISAQNYILNINEGSFAGYNDWRLPTLEEAMSLIEPRTPRDHWYTRGHMYINPIFDMSEISLPWIWTADHKEDEKSVWRVGFSNAFCISERVDNSLGTVLAVRGNKKKSGKSPRSTSSF